MGLLLVFRLETVACSTVDGRSLVADVMRVVTALLSYSFNDSSLTLSYIHIPIVELSFELLHWLYW